MTVGLIFILDRSTLSIANHAVSHDLGLSPVQMGLLLSAFSWAYAISQVPMGLLLDAIGSRIVLAAGILLWSTGQILTSFVPGLWEFYCARFLLGLGEAPIFPAGAKMIAEWFTARERGAPTGLFLASTTIGPVLAPPIITGLVLSLGWRTTYLALGGLGIVLLVAWLVLVPTYRDRMQLKDDGGYFGVTKSSANARPSIGAMKVLLSQQATWGLILGFVGIIYMVWLYLTWLPVYLEHERHFSIRTVGWVLSIPYIFGTLGNILSGHLADFLFRRGIPIIASRKYLICIGLMGGAIFTIPVAYTPSAQMAVLYLCCVMFFLYLASAGAWALLNVVAPPSRIATIGSLQNCAGYFAGSLAPIITGFLLQQTGSFRSALMMSSGVAVASAISYFVLVKAPISENEPSLSRLAEAGAFGELDV